MDPLQQQHAEKIKEITQQRRDDAKASPEQRIQQMIKEEVAKAIAAAMAAAPKITLTQAKGITITGQYPDFTIGQQPISFTVTPTCNDDGTIEIKVVSA